MMAIHSSKNLYRGVNAHLNSVLQNEPGDWESFHVEHIVHIRELLEPRLPSGYLARSEKSLQIREVGADPSPTDRTIPDVTVFQRGGNIETTSLTPLMSSVEPAATLLAVDTFLDPEDELRAVMIWDVRGGLPGRPVTRIELLSASNKPGNAGFLTYLTKRRDTLRSGINLVEIDLLHQISPVIRRFPSYARHEAGAYPYLICISDMRASVEAGATYVYGWHVDDPIPTLDIPLSGTDVVSFDFDAAYRRTFEAARYYESVVDYEQLPVRFETYADFDQQCIRAVMARVEQEQT